MIGAKPKRATFALRFISLGITSPFTVDERRTLRRVVAQRIKGKRGWPRGKIFDRTSSGDNVKSIDKIYFSLTDERGSSQSDIY